MKNEVRAFKSDDPFAPPVAAVDVVCIHCGLKYSSALIWFDREIWRCPVVGCDGKGFGFDIWEIVKGGSGDFPADYFGPGLPRWAKPRELEFRHRLS